MLKNVKTENKELNELQENVDVALRTQAARPLADAVLVENVALTTSNREVRHGLTGPPRGWIVVKGNAGVTVYSDTTHATPTEFIYLKGTASLTCSILFF